MEFKEGGADQPREHLTPQQVSDILQVPLMAKLAAGKAVSRMALAAGPDTEIPPFGNLKQSMAGGEAFANLSRLITGGGERPIGARSGTG